MKNLIIKTNQIEATEIASIIEEIEKKEDLMTTAVAMATRSGIAIGDMVEAIASHISYTDTDYVIM